VDASIVTEEEIVRVFSLTESQHTAHQRALDELDPLFDQSFPVIEGLGYVIEQLVSLIPFSLSPLTAVICPPPQQHLRIQGQKHLKVVCGARRQSELFSRDGTTMEAGASCLPSVSLKGTVKIRH